MSEKKRFKIKMLLINKYIRIGMISILLISIFGTGYLTWHTTKNKLTEKKTNLYSYANKANVQYRVVLLPNIIYNEKSIAAGGTYITDFTDYIATSLKYNFEGERQAEIKGKYNIVAIVEGILSSEKTSKTVWKKQYELQPLTDFTAKDSKVNIEKELPIKLSPYNAFAEEAVKASGVGFDTKLTILWNISIEGKADKGTFKEQLTPTMEIPLRSKYYEIKGSLSQEREGAIEKIEKIIISQYSTKMEAFYIILGALIILLVLTLFFTYSPKYLNAEQKEKNRILKQYNDSLAAFNGEIDTKGSTVIRVNTIEDIVKISDDIGRPILYNSSNTNEKLTFYIIDRNVIYIYKLTQNGNENMKIAKGGKSVPNGITT